MAGFLWCLALCVSVSSGNAFMLHSNSALRSARLCHASPSPAACPLVPQQALRTQTGKSVRTRAAAQTQMAATMEGNTGYYCLHVCLCVKPERRDEFLKCIQDNQRGTMTTEPLAVLYLFGEDETSPNKFHFFEAYKGRAGFEAHTKAPHFADWEKFVATDPLSAEPQVQFYTESPVSGETTRLPELAEEHYCLGVTVVVKPERRDEFLKNIQANQRGTRSTEKLVVSYLYGEDNDAKNTFYLFEAYKGRAGFEAHTGSEHFAVWSKFVDTTPFTTPPQLDFYKSQTFSK